MRATSVRFISVASLSIAGPLFGHEVIGIVDSVGSGVNGFRKGERVGVHHLFLRAREGNAFYSFTPGEPQKWGSTVRLGVVRLLLESARLQDEASTSDPLTRLLTNK